MHSSCCCSKWFEKCDCYKVRRLKDLVCLGGESQAARVVAVFKIALTPRLFHLSFFWADRKAEAKRKEGRTDYKRSDLQFSLLWFLFPRLKHKKMPVTRFSFFP